MIPILINGFAPRTDRETKVFLAEETGGSPALSEITEAHTDDDGLARLEVSESYIGKTIAIVAMAHGQKYMRAPITVDRDGVFRTVTPIPDPGQVGHPVLALPAGWHAKSTVAMEQLRRVTTFASLTLRRAREDSRVRYSQHFTSLWSAFNSWYNEELTSPGSDRDCIDALKAGVDRAGQKLHAAIDALAQPSELTYKSQHTNPLSEGRRCYRLPTALTNFVQRVFEHPVARQGFYVGNAAEQPPKAGRFAPKCAPLAYLPADLYDHLYKKMHDALAELSGGMLEDPISLQEVLRSLGIGMVGNVMYPTTPIFLSKHPFVVAKIEQECKNIDIISRMQRVVAESTNASIHYGFLELLYSVRNLIMHGALSPFDPANEELLEASYKILDLLILETSKT